jgi:hypothetical protein
VSIFTEQHTPITENVNGTTGHGDVVTLRAFAPGGHYRGTPAVTGEGQEVVVLGYTDTGADLVDVHTPHGPRTLPADTVTFPLADAHRRADLLAGAVDHLADHVREVRSELACTVARHARTLEEIRRYAIDRHLDDQYCRDGLNTFLRSFGMPVYEPRVRVEFTITGSYEVDHADLYQAERDATGYLKIDLSDIDDLVDDSDTFTVQVTDTTVLDT